MVPFDRREGDASAPRPDPTMYVLKRVLTIAGFLVGLSFALFCLLSVLPGSPEDRILASNPDLSGAELDRIRALRGLDRPVTDQYLCWLWGRDGAAGDAGRCAWWPGGEGLVRGDLGYSQVHRLPVDAIIVDRLENTLTLMIPAFLIALMLALPLGMVSATRQHRFADHAIGALSFAGISLPVHWFALVAVLLFSVELGWFPASGVGDVAAPGLLDTIHHAVLPVAILAAFYVGRWTRHLRGAMLEVIRQDYVTTARAKGLSERAVLWRHGLRNALIPLVTVVAQSLPALFSGALVTERVFGYPGMGLLIFESVEADDHLVAIVVFLIAALLTMSATLLADLLYFWLDPRIRGDLAEAQGTAP